MKTICEGQDQDRTHDLETKQARRIGERDPRSSARLGVLDNLAERSSAKLSARLASLRDARHAKSYAFCMIGTTLFAHSRSQISILVLIL